MSDFKGGQDKNKKNNDTLSPSPDHTDTSYLTLNDFHFHLDKNAILVNDEKSLIRFSKYVEDFTLTKKAKNTATATTLNNNVNGIAEMSWGLDCEWKPVNYEKRKLRNNKKLDDNDDETTEMTANNDQSMDDSDRKNDNTKLKKTKKNKKNNPVETLQLSTFEHAFLIDLQTLCNQNQADDSDVNLAQQGVSELHLNNTPERISAPSSSSLSDLLSKTLTKLFANPQIPIIGYGIENDLNMLCASFPNLSCFHFFHTVVDLQKMFKFCDFTQNNNNTEEEEEEGEKEATSSVALNTDSLSNIITHMWSSSGKELEKTQQCSDWSIRPFSEDQIQYALLDAIVLPKIFQMFLQRIPKTLYDNDKEEGDQDDSILANFSNTILDKIPQLKSTTSYHIIDILNEDNSDNDDVYYAPSKPLPKRCGIKSIMGVHFAKYNHSIINDGDGDDSNNNNNTTLNAIQAITFVKKSKKNRQDEQKKRSKARKERNKQKRKDLRENTVKLYKLDGDFGCLPIPGSLMDYTKDSCIRSILGLHSSSNDDFECESESGNQQQPQRQSPQKKKKIVRLGYNRRAGILSIKNGWILFINLGGRNNMYQNQIFDQGKFIVFTMMNVSKKNIPCLLLYEYILKQQAQQEQEQFGNHEEEGSGREHGEDGKEKKIFLFLRSGSKSKFMYCGECAVTFYGDQQHTQHQILHQDDRDNKNNDETNNENANDRDDNDDDDQDETKEKTKNDSNGGKSSVDVLLELKAYDALIRTTSMAITSTPTSEIKIIEANDEEMRGKENDEGEDSVTMAIPKLSDYYSMVHEYFNQDKPFP